MSVNYIKYNPNKFEAHSLVYNMIPFNAKVMDVGCSTGYFGQRLKEKNCIVYGIDNNIKALKIAKKYYSNVYQIDLNELNYKKLINQEFNYILILDVLEHLLYPERSLIYLKNALQNKGTFIISVPNIAHLSIRLMIMRGNFKYTKQGILDETHLHFFTLKSFKKLLLKCGFCEIDTIPSSGINQVPILHKFTDRLPESIQYKIVKKFPSLFAYQFIAICNPT